MGIDLRFYKDKTVLVTGSTCFKGIGFCRMLVNAGAKVIGYALKAPTEPSLYNAIRIENEIIAIEGDIRDLNSLLAVFEETHQRLYFT